MILPINKKTLIALAILMSLSTMSCISAMDLNDTGSEAAIVLEDTQNVSSMQPEVLSAQNDELLSAESINSSDSGDLLAADSKSASNDDESAYLVLDNDANRENIYVGEYVTWIITVDNLGPGTAKNVKVRDVLPDGLKYVSHTLSRGTFNITTGIWDIGDMLKGTGEYLYIKTIAVAVGEMINEATLMCDSVNLNNETFEEEEIDVFDYPSEKQSEPVQINDQRATGNPLVLAFLSLFGCFACYMRRD